MSADRTPGVARSGTSLPAVPEGPRTVVGGGAIGGTLAFHLARAGHAVEIVDTGPVHVRAIREAGLTLRGPAADARRGRRGRGGGDGSRYPARTVRRVHAGGLPAVRRSTGAGGRHRPARGLARRAGQGRSGIWRDIAVHRRPSEVPHHYRPVLRSAARLGVPTPLLGGLLTLLGEVETGNRPLRPRNLMDLSSLVPSGGEQ